MLVWDLTELFSLRPHVDRNVRVMSQPDVRNMQQQTQHKTKTSDETHCSQMILSAIRLI